MGWVGGWVGGWRWLAVVGGGLVSGEQARRVCEGENSVCGILARGSPWGPANLEPRDYKRLPEAMHTEQRLGISIGGGACGNRR
jgi:hypothetical protein